MSEILPNPTDRRALLAGIGGLAAGTFLAASRAEAGSLTPPGAPIATRKPLTEVEPRTPLSNTNNSGRRHRQLCDHQTNPGVINGDSYAGNLGSTDPTANFTP